jgi:hypothetical protein
LNSLSPLASYAVLGSLFMGSSAAAEDTRATDPVRLGVYVESYYAWNFDRPRNQITHFRGFDNRHDSFTLSNVALDAAAARDGLSARVTLQFGHTPNTYYLAEPALPATAATGESDRFAWRFLQQALVGWQPSRTPRLLLEGGLCLSPVGPEGIAVKDNWNWSRSNLFFGLPFYHTGARATWDLGGGTKLSGAVYNGWNNVTDNNGKKSLAAQVQHSRSGLDASALYFGGVERSPGAPEGDAWRHLFDAWVRVQPLEALWLMVHANAGVEPNDIEQSSWYATALYARARLAPRLFIAARGDWFVEAAGAGASGRPAPIFWGTFDADGQARVASATVTLDAQPREGLLVRVEYRYDDASVDVYFDETTSSAAPNAHKQSTVTLGTVVWF